jgi:hypothetical protein
MWKMLGNVAARSFDHVQRHRAAREPLRRSVAGGKHRTEAELAQRLELQAAEAADT